MFSTWPARCLLRKCLEVLSAPFLGTEGDMGAERGPALWPQDGEVWALMEWQALTLGWGGQACPGWAKAASTSKDHPAPAPQWAEPALPR